MHDSLFFGRLFSGMFIGHFSCYSKHSTEIKKTKLQEDTNMSRYERAYYKGYTDGSSAAGSKYPRRSTADRAAWICFSVSVFVYVVSYRSVVRTF